jgi:uroporphyrinogen-III synthase
VRLGLLQGQRFVLTRDARGNAEVKAKLLKNGARVLDLPGFAYHAVPLTPQSKKILKTLDSSDWIVFTSVRAVEFFLKRVPKRNFLKKLKVAAVGERTAASLRKCGVRVHLTPKSPSAKNLAKENVFQKTKNLKIFYPKAKDARDEFVKSLQRKHKIQSLVIYSKKRLPLTSENRKKLFDTQIGWVLFYSPSAVQAFLKNFRGKKGIQLLKSVRLAVIGETTAKFLKSLGLKCAVQSKKSTTDDLLKAIYNSIPTKSA